MSGVFFWIIIAKKPGNNIFHRLQSFWGCYLCQLHLRALGGVEGFAWQPKEIYRSRRIVAASCAVLESSKCRHNKLPEWWDTKSRTGLRRLNQTRSRTNVDIFMHPETPGCTKPGWPAKRLRAPFFLCYWAIKAAHWCDLKQQNSKI